MRLSSHLPPVAEIVPAEIVPDGAVMSPVLVIISPDEVLILPDVVPICPVVVEIEPDEVISPHKTPLKILLPVPNAIIWLPAELFT